MPEEHLKDEDDMVLVMVEMVEKCQEPSLHGHTLYPERSGGLSVAIVKCDTGDMENAATPALENLGNRQMENVQLQFTFN